MCGFRSRRLKVTFIISSLFITSLAFGQYTEDLSKVRPTYTLLEDSTTTSENTVDSNQTPAIIDISQNAQVDSVMDIMADQNTRAPYNQTNGYRIQVYSGDDKTKAEEIKTRLDELELLDDIATYKLFESGFIWRVKVGDFQTRLDAYRLYKKLKDDFPNCLLVPERKVNLN